MKQLIALFVLLGLLLGSCNPAGSAGHGFKKSDIAWAKQTNFKLSFEDDNEDYQRIGGHNDKGLINKIIHGVQEGSIPAYDYYEKTKLNPEQIKAMFYPTDTIYVMDPETYEEKVKVVKNEMDLTKVTKFRIKQDWYFDEKNIKMYSNIKAIAPVRTVYDDSGNYRGDLPLFWVMFEEIEA